MTIASIYYSFVLPLSPPLSSIYLVKFIFHLLFCHCQLPPPIPISSHHLYQICALGIDIATATCTCFSLPRPPNAAWAFPIDIFVLVLAFVVVVMVGFNLPLPHLAICWCWSLWLHLVSCCSSYIGVGVCSRDQLQPPPTSLGDPFASAFVVMVAI